MQKDLRRWLCEETGFGIEADKVIKMYSEVAVSMKQSKT